MGKVWRGGGGKKIYAKNKIRAKKKVMKKNSCGRKVQL